MAKAKEKEAEAEEKDEKKEEGAAEAKPEGDAKEGEGGEGGEGAEGAAPKKSKKKIIIIGVAALVVLLAAGGGGYFFFAGHKHQEAANVELGPDGKPIEKPVFYTLPDFLVNLNSGTRQTSFLKTTIILEVAHEADVPVVEANLPRVLDAFNTYLRELRASDLAGSAGIQRLREELLLRANKALAPMKINDVLFKEIIVQ